MRYQKNNSFNLIWLFSLIYHDSQIKFPWEILFRYYENLSWDITK